MLKKIAFIKVGSFSHINANVEAMLRRHFAEYDLEVIDVEGLLSQNQDVEFFNKFAILKYYGADLLRRRRTFHECRFRTPYMFAWIGRTIGKLLSHNRSDYVFSFQTQSLFDASTPGLPHFVYTDHTHLANLLFPAFDRSKLFAGAWIDLEASIYRNAARTFTMSRHVQRSLLEHYHCAPERVSCVFAGSNANSRSTALQNDNYRNKRILFVGTDWERKGGPVLAEAFRIVQRQHPDAKLAIVGCSPQLKLDNCEIAGWVPPERMHQYYARASVFCVPTRREPFGIVFLEALQNKIPVVATRFGAIPDFVENGRSGYLVEPDDSAELARALGELISDPEKCSRFGEHGCRTVFERYTWEATGDRIRQHVQAAIQR